MPWCRAPKSSRRRSPVCGCRRAHLLITSIDGTFRPEQTLHTEISLERDLAAGVSRSLRGFNQRVNDQLVELFDVDRPVVPHATRSLLRRHGRRHRHAAGALG